MIKHIRPASASVATEHWRDLQDDVEVELSDLTTPEDFDAACAAADAPNVLEKVRASADVAQHIEWIQQDLELGYDRVFLHNVVRQEQERFINVCAEQLLPQLQSSALVGE